MKNLLFTFLLLSVSFILNAQINLATDGSKASASDTHASGPAANAFDDNTSTGWLVTSSPVQWIQYDFESPVVINGYAMHYLSDSITDYQPVSWVLRGSDNEADWTDIDTITDDPISFKWEEFVTENTDPYRYYRFYISEAGSDTLAVGELQLYSITLPSVVTGEVTYIEAELAACSGEVTMSGGSPVTQRGICYNTIGNPTLSDSYRFSSAGVGSFNVTLPSLSPNTTYYFRAFATNALGTEYATEVKTFTTDKFEQSITFPAIPGKTYGDSDFNADAVSSSGLTVSLASSNPAVATITGDHIQITGAGSSVITASQPGNSVYAAATPVNRTLTVSKKVLTSTADNKEKNYGDSNPVFTISYTGFITGDDWTVLDTEPVAGTVADEYSNAGTYFITLANGSDNNYSFNYVPGILTVNKIPLSASADNKNKTYGEANPEFTTSYSGFVNGEDLSVIDVVPVATSIAGESSNAGFYPIAVSGGGDNNYSFIYTDGTLTVQKAQLVATADDQVKIYGDTNPELTITYSGFVNNDNVSDLDTPPVAFTTATETTGTGTYSITVSGGSDTNYNFNFADGTLTVGKAVLSAIADDAEKYTGETNPEFEILYTGFLNNDTPDDIDNLPTTSCMANESSPAGTYAIELNGGADNNYSFDYTNGILTVLEYVSAIPQTESLSPVIYPIPATDRIYIDQVLPEKLKVQVLSPEGKIMLQEILSGNSIDVTGIPSGLYLIRIYSDSQVWQVQPIIIE